MKKQNSHNGKRYFSMIRAEKISFLKKELLSWLIHFGIAAIAAVTIWTFAFQLVRVDGESMLDTLHDHEIMFVTKYDYILGSPDRDDVIICHYPNSKALYVKRLIGLPGDTIEIVNHRVLRNGVLLDEDYLTPVNNDSSYQRNMFALQLAENEYFVLGDNRDNSHDSRFANVGTLTRSQIRGHVQFILFPFQSIRKIE